MTGRLTKVGVALLLAATAASVSAQYGSSGLAFLKAVKDRDGSKATELLRADGSTVANFTDDKGDGALHIVVARRDDEWLGFMLGNKADPNAQNRAGDTPLILAARVGYLDGANLLLRTGAKVDLANRLGETPLIIAVQQRNAALVRQLLEAGANPDKTDNASGRSARDYAKLDRRSTELTKLIETTKAPARASVAGPKL